MLRKTAVLAIVLGAALCLPAPAKMKVKTQHQAGNDCKQYKTYEWLPTRAARKTGIIENEETSTPVIKEIINRELQAKGLKEVPAGGDLQIATLSTREKSPHTDALIYTWFPDYYYGTYWSSGSPAMVLTSYANVGTFVLNLIDAKTKKSAWVALATDTVDSQKMAREKLEKAAKKMFEDFPPKKP
ncbi:MAG: DUF4136 domain-containing protein [Acidobacteria bacterium]|nr:DUF4136 domain-containing protein [Acidobacteriota bacterium]